jgi:hypothetical protein
MRNDPDYLWRLVNDPNYSYDDYLESLNQPEPEDKIFGIPVSEIDRAYDKAR